LVADEAVIYDWDGGRVHEHEDTLKVERNAPGEDRLGMVHDGVEAGGSVSQYIVIDAMTYMVDKVKQTATPRRYMPMTATSALLAVL
jgi:hypothetical protein